MERIYIRTRSEWRQWLAENHDKELDGIWLVFEKRATGKAVLEYEDAVEEALCYGWIDSIIKRIDDESYCRKFTPRRRYSKWSSANKLRVAKIIKAGRMTEFGSAKIEAAKRSGAWNLGTRPPMPTEIPEALEAALGRNRAAKEFFDSLAPSYRKQFIWWITSAKGAETRAKRLKASLDLLERREKLGLK